MSPFIALHSFCVLQENLRHTSKLVLPSCLPPPRHCHYAHIYSLLLCFFFISVFNVFFYVITSPSPWSRNTPLVTVLVTLRCRLSFPHSRNKLPAHFKSILDWQSAIAPQSLEGNHTLQAPSSPGRESTAPRNTGQIPRYFDISANRLHSAQTTQEILLQELKTITAQHTNPSWMLKKIWSNHSFRTLFIYLDEELFFRPHLPRAWWMWISGFVFQTGHHNQKHTARTLIPRVKATKPFYLCHFIFSKNTPRLPTHPLWEMC